MLTPVSRAIYGSAALINLVVFPSYAMAKWLDMLSSVFSIFPIDVLFTCYSSHSASAYFLWSSTSEANCTLKMDSRYNPDLFYVMNLCKLVVEPHRFYIHEFEHAIF
jgi:hypothetical protein